GATPASPAFVGARKRATQASPQQKNTRDGASVDRAIFPNIRYHVFAYQCMPNQQRQGTPTMPSPSFDPKSTGYELAALRPLSKLFPNVDSATAEIARLS